MGTRAAFWIGDPRDTDNCEWLGCVALDGYMESFPELTDVDTPEAFREQVMSILDIRDDAAIAGKHGWPFPWTDDVFLTDTTFAFFDDATQVTSFHRGFVRLDDWLSYNEEEKIAYYDAGDTLPSDTAIASEWDRAAPDSIMILRVAD